MVIDPQGDGADVPSVVGRNRFGALAAMEYLLGLGHRRIGFIGGRPDILSGRRRFEGYRDALAAAGIPFDPDLVQEGDYTRERGQQAARLLLDRPGRPTAIFAANDQSAMGMMDAAHELGLRIPDDVSVVGFDNVPEAAQVTPRLTTVDQSIQEMGRLATRMLIGILHSDTPAGSSAMPDRPAQAPLKVPTRLVIREFVPGDPDAISPTYSRSSLDLPS